MDQIKKVLAKLMDQIKIKNNKIFQKKFFKLKKYQTKKTILLKNGANTYFLQTINSG